MQYPPSPTPSRTGKPALTNGIAFALGVGLSALPAVGPLAAVLLVFARVWALQRSDLVWAFAAVAFALPSALRGDVLATLTGVGTVIGPWIVFRTFHELRRTDASDHLGRPMAWGLLVGYAAIVGFGLAASLAAVRTDEVLTVLSAFAWQRSPAMYGHVVLTVGALIAVSARRHMRVWMSALGLAALGVLVSGSLEAAIGWIVLAVGTILLQGKRGAWIRLAQAGSVAAIAFVALALAPTLGWGRIGFVLAGDTVRPAANLFAGTEIPRGDWWDDHWVSIRTSRVELGGKDLVAYEVTKRGEEHWHRLQQRVELKPGSTYTLSGWIDTTTATAAGVIPGFQGYGLPSPAVAEDAANVRPLVLDARWRSGEWTGSLSGPGRFVGSSVLDTQGSWHRVAVTFEVGAGSDAILWHVGFTPDAQPGSGGTSRVAGMMLEVGPGATSYVPGSASSGLTFGYARAPLWSAALEGISQRPWLGWGSGTFPVTYATTRPGIDRQELVPAHPHNLLLGVTYERGLVGLVGLLALFTALFGLALRRHDAGFMLVIAVLLILNTFDATLLAGGILYPLAAAAGWRSATQPADARAGNRGVGSLLARLSLAVADALAALAGLGIALAVATSRGVDVAWSLPLLYVVAVWPALSMREGLYPGYGLTPAQELKKQVSAWFLASVLVTLGALLFPSSIDVPLGALGIWLVTTLLGMTAGRAFTKRGLRAIGVWGRPVIVLGAGRTGQRIARALKRTPLDGLDPVAFFDDDPAMVGSDVGGLPVIGTLDAAPAFAEREGVRHAIVAIPSLEWGRLDHLISGHGKALRRVQFIPRLGSLPSDDVAVSDLDGMLALEVRNGLYAPVNRVTKRLSDVALTMVGAVLVAPVIALLWVLVRLDSRGGGFHASERVGEGGRTFRCWKFRTMFEDAEVRLEEILDAEPALREQYETWHKLDDDPRVTRFGRFLRRTSLDELPQVWNVLKGEMSLVGPRPYLQREMRDMGRYADIIFQAKPGITGHWQVTARNTVTFDDRLEIEAHYIRNWSIWWDAILLFRTPLAVLSGKGEAK